MSVCYIKQITFIIIVIIIIIIIGVAIIIFLLFVWLLCILAIVGSLRRCLSITTGCAGDSLGPCLVRKGVAFVDTSLDVLLRSLPKWLL